MRTYNKTQEDRKILVNRIDELTGEKLIYTKMPLCSYEGCGFTVTKEGNLEVDDSADAAIVETLIAEELIERPEIPSLTVSLPASRHNGATLRNLKPGLYQSRPAEQSPRDILPGGRRSNGLPARRRRDDHRRRFSQGSCRL